MNSITSQKPINYQEVIKNKIKTWDEDKLNARVTAEMNKIQNNKNLNEIEQKEQIENLKKISQKIEPRNLQNPEEIVKGLQEYSEKFTPEDLNQIIAMRRTWQDSQVDNRTINKLNSTLQKSLSVFANLFKMNQAIMPKELTIEILLMLNPEDFKNWEESNPQIKEITKEASFQSKFLINNNNSEEYTDRILEDLNADRPINGDMMNNLFSYASLDFQRAVWERFFIARMSEEDSNKLMIKFLNKIPDSVEKFVIPPLPSNQVEAAIARFFEKPNKLKEIDTTHYYVANHETLKKILNNSPNLEKINLMEKWQLEIIQELKNLKKLNTLSIAIEPSHLLKPDFEKRLNELVACLVLKI